MKTGLPSGRFPAGGRCGCSRRSARSHRTGRIALDLIRKGLVSVDHMLSATNFVPIEGIQGAFEALCRPSSELQMVVEF